MPLVGESRLVQYRRGQARYVPVARIAAGGMAEVWRGRAHFSDGHVEEVAIKRVLPSLAKNFEYRRMLEDEARIGMLLRHPNIVRVFDGRAVGDTFILVMELVEGASLRELNGRLMRAAGRVPVAAALHMAREVARALAHAHEAMDEWGRELNIVHRDVSPHNVLIDVNGRVLLMDFGLANSSANLAERDPQMIGGKFGYISPELVLEQKVTPQLDLFGLGIMLWEGLTGQRLFRGSDDQETVRKVVRCEVPAASSLNGQVTEEIDQLLAGLLARRPSDRYQSAREVVVDLEYLLAKHPLQAGVAGAAALVRAHQSALHRERNHTGTISTSLSAPSSSGVVPTAPRSAMPVRIPPLHSVPGVPRLPAALAEGVGALPVPARARR